MPPANRKVLAYHVAANAIMAGCPPEYMPLCIAIVRCFANGNFYKSLASTHGWTPYVLISGPIARQLGFSYEDGMINEEWLQRFVRDLLRLQEHYHLCQNEPLRQQCTELGRGMEPDK